MICERNALMEHTYPKLKDFCRKHGLEFQVKCCILLIEHDWSQGRIQDFPLGGRQPSLEGAPTSDTGAFLVKTDVKTKEFGPVGGGRRKLLYVDPPLGVDCLNMKDSINIIFQKVQVTY